MLRVENFFSTKVSLHSKKPKWGFLFPAHPWFSPIEGAFTFCKPPKGGRRRAATGRTTAAVTRDHKRKETGGVLCADRDGGVHFWG